MENNKLSKKKNKKTQFYATFLQIVGLLACRAKSFHAKFYTTCQTKTNLVFSRGGGNVQYSVKSGI